MLSIFCGILQIAVYNIYTEGGGGILFGDHNMEFDKPTSEQTNGAENRRIWSLG